jgi:3-phosphoshikimate 1-carboxyvinyltransferase
MALPDLIEIVPLDTPVRAEITVPGSKSITNRALILAALADGEVTLIGALWSEDTQIMADCLRKLGFEIRIEPDPEEFCNRTITVKGLGGNIPNGGTAEKPLELFVGNAGTAARFLAAFVCLGDGVYRLSGVPRMHERPQAALFQALRELGYHVESKNGNDNLPVTIFGRDTVSVSPNNIRDGGTPSLPRKCRVSIEESSQFASALLLCAKVRGWKVEVVGENDQESPYVAMTAKIIEAFPHRGGKFKIEPDASSKSYFDAIKLLFPFSPKEITTILRGVSGDLENLQIDNRFSEVFRSKETISRQDDLGDSIMTGIAIATFEITKKQFTNLQRLRFQETERVVALRTELTKCGAKVVEEGDTLTVWPSPLHGAVIETYNDHRMAMCFAILGLKVPGIKIKNPACVKKTFPNFFQKLAAPPPKGLGATILDAKTGRKLEPEELFAD